MNRLTFILLLLPLAMAGCVYEPAGYAYSGPGYYAPAPAYYGPPPAYYGWGPSIGFGFGERGHWR